MKLIDILNKIANGELKEGTKVIWKVKECWGDIEYTYKDGDLEREVCGETIYVYDEMFSRHLKDEVELIEPNDFGKSDKMAKHNHFADDGKMAETNQFREDTKMIETTDNTKIEGLTYSDFWEWDAWSEGTDEEEFVGVETATKILFDKLNEVIIYINKENNNE